MYDVIVAGGGVVGATAAYLCARGGLRTLLLDRVDTGRATDAGAGIIAPRTSTRSEVLFELGLRSGDFYPTLLGYLAEDGGGDTGYARCGDLRVAVTEDELEHFGALVADPRRARARHGYPTAEDVREVSPDDARALFPCSLARSGRCTTGRRRAWTGGCSTRRCLMAAAQRKVTLVGRGRIVCVVESGRVAGVAAGAEVHRAGHRHHRRRRMDPSASRAARRLDRGRAAARADHPSSGGGPRYRRLAGGACLPRPLHRLVGRRPRRRPAPRGETGSGFDPRITAAGVHEVLGEALRVAPTSRGRACLETRVGLRPLSADGLPILGPVPGVAGAFVATGHGPSGLTLGPYSAALVTELVLGSCPALDLTPFRADRFTGARQSAPPTTADRLPAGVSAKQELATLPELGESP